MTTLKRVLPSGMPVFLPAAQAAAHGAVRIDRNRALFADDSNETVEAQRRRRGTGGPSGRAEMPGRPSGSDRGSSQQPPSGGGGLPSWGGGRSSGGNGLPIGIVILILVIYFIYQPVHK